MVETFGDKLKNQREKMNLSTQQVGESSGINNAMPIGLEASAVFPSKIIIEKLASSVLLGLPYLTLKSWRDALHGKIPLARPLDCPVIGWPYCGHGADFQTKPERA